MRLQAIRRKVLEDWRGLPEPPDFSSRCKPIKEVMTALIPKLGLADRIDEEEMRRTWTSLVGDFLAAHSAPDSLRSGVLTVSVLQPSVRFELDRTWKTRVLSVLQQRFGAHRIREVRFR
jgi:predicted nucleic acid-binding Zn ribbon protein